MKTVIHRCLLGALALLLGGCATPYQKFQWYVMYAGGGYMDKELEPGVYRVRTIPSVLTNPKRGDAYTLYRCAEITVEHDCDYFAIITDRLKNGRPQSIQDAVTFLATGIDLSAGRDTPVIRDPVIIRTFKGEKPPDYPEAVKAKKVMAQLKPKVMKLWHHGLNDWASGELEPPAAGPGNLLAEELTRKLAGLGSLQAEYRAFSPDGRAADLTFQVNQAQKYCLCWLAPADAGDETDPTNIIGSVLDFSLLNDESRTIQMLAFKGNEGKKFTLSLQKLFERADNPFSAFYLIARQIGAERKVWRTTTGPGGPELTLALDATNLAFYPEISSGRKTLSASWLDRNIITNVIKVVATPDSVQFTYPSNHVVLIDRKTGLLAVDSWPDPARPGLREIILQHYSPLPRNVPCASAIPGFADIHFEKLPDPQVYEHMSFSFLADLRRKLAAMENFEESLRNHSADLTAAFRELGRRNNRGMTQDLEAARFRNETLIPDYKRYLQNHPDKAKTLTFNRYLDIVLAECEANPRDLLSIPEVRASMEKARLDCQGAIRQLPEDNQKPLMELYDVCMPAFYEGNCLGYISKRIKQVKALKTPQMK